MTLNKFDLSGKTALITGGAGLLGEQHALALAECGAKVILTDINLDAAQTKAREISKTHDSISALSMDVYSLPSIQQVMKQLGSVHILVNNAAIDYKVKAGGGSGGSRFETFSLERWEKEIAIGLTGAFLCSQVFGTWMATHGGGVILNIASDLSVIAPDQRIYSVPGLSENEQPAKPVTYSAIKTGLVGLTRYLAAYWAEKKVRVNALSPGGVYVDQSPEFVQKLSNLIPLGRMAQIDEYRSSVQFLCSEASSYLTGQNIVIDGGRSIL